MACPNIVQNVKTLGCRAFQQDEEQMANLKITL